MPDPDYTGEADAARQKGFPYALIDYEVLVGGDAQHAARRVEARETETHGLYRGWMLRPEQYAALYHALADRGIRLINSPTAYTHCHYLPVSYDVIAPYTARTVWLETGPDVPVDLVTELLRTFGNSPVIVKDFVKSRKHEWDEACYIPSASDYAAIERVVRRFITLQGPDLVGGLVFREYIPFERLGAHPKTGMPMTREYRIFWLDGEPIYVAPYWAEGNYGDVMPPVDRFCPVARRVRSRFFTMDVARRQGGDWLIVELGDGQVAGIPDSSEAPRFYTALAEHWPDEESAVGSAG